MRRLLWTAGLTLILAASIHLAALAGTDPGAPDSIWFNHVAWNGDTAFSVTMSTSNDEALKQATIILTWNSTKIAIDSVSLVGSRWAGQVRVDSGYFIADTGRIGGVVSLNHYNISFLPFATLLPTGSGPACRMFFKRTGAVVTDPIIVIDSSTTTSGTNVSNSTLFGTSALPAGNFIPTFRRDTISITPCVCDHQGDIVLNAFIDVQDVLQCIKVAFVNGTDITDPNCPKSRCDVNKSGVVDVQDVLYIIKTAFTNGPAPVNPCGP
jgi:hypothetical protein